MYSDKVKKNTLTQANVNQLLDVLVGEESNDEILNKLLENEAFVGKLFSDLFSNDKFLNLLLNDSRFQTLCLENVDFLNKIANNKAITGNEKLQNNLLSKLEFQTKAASDSRVQIIALQNQQMLNRTVVDQNFLKRVKALLIKDEAFHQQILNDDRFFDVIVESPAYMAKLKSNRNLLTKLTNLNSWDKIEKLPYALPTYVVGFPRSGTNFLQSVLQGSSGMKCQSMYSNVIEDSNEILSLKSHAFSKASLFDEINRLIPDLSYQSNEQKKKVISIFRDPRDVMPSFYDFVSWRKNASIPQKDFLKTCYFFATYQERHKMMDRGSEFQSVNIKQAYKKHVANWYRKDNKDIELYTVKYEDLVLCPDIAFKGIFEFLELDCQLAKEMLGRKVAEFSGTARKRGVAYGWKAKMSNYAELIESVNEHLSREITAMGYEI